MFIISFSKAQVLINEYSAANFDSYLDNYNEYEDWIELYNSSNNSVDLNGWYLSDRASNPMKWSFTSSFIIPANGVAVIFCSSRDEIIGNNAHTNFKLTQTKNNEKIILSNPTGTIVDSVDLVPNLTSHSRGRETNGSINWSVFTTPTPSANNFNAQLEYSEKPSFSQAAGYYTGSVTVSITTNDPNASIYYTTNGDQPTINSSIYNSPITLTTTSVLKAISVSSLANVPVSFTEYATYFINDTHTIPILSISGDSVDVLIEDGVQNIGSWWNGRPHEPHGTVEWFNAQGVLIDKGTGDFNKHGNDSWAYDQRGFDYVMRDQFGYNYALKDDLFYTKDRDEYQRVIVKAAANDNYPASFGGSGAHIRDAYIQHLSQISDLRMDERSSSNCILYMNGRYWGVYEIREKVDDHDFTDHYYDQQKDSIQFLKTWGGTWVEYGGAQAQTDWDNLKNYVLSNPMNNAANYSTVKSQFNTGSLIDYFLLNSYVVCADWLNWNTAWWRGLAQTGEKKKWRYTLWDMDNTFGHGTNYTGIPTQSVNADPCDPSSLNDPGGQGHIPIWNALITNEDFFDDYINRWQDLANGHLSCANMIDVLDSMVNVIDPEMPAQIARWGGSYSTWQQNVQDLRNFINQRCSTMNVGFVPCYQPAISGPYDVTVEILGQGEVEMSNNNFINDGNTPWYDQRFGGVKLPFEVKSGNFQNWDVVPSGVYTYDPNVDTLVLDLQGNVTVIANFIAPIPTKDVVFNISTAGTNTSLNINGNNIVNFPHTETFLLNDTVDFSANIDPLYSFLSWVSDSNYFNNGATSINNSFYVLYNDTITLNIFELPTISAFISGNDTICENSKSNAEINFSFNGVAPHTFTYSINGDIQPSITTMNPFYFISTKTEGVYDLVSYFDANEQGNVSGQAIVTIKPAPTSSFTVSPDTISNLNLTTQLYDQSSGYITSRIWDFGDNSPNQYDLNPTHTYSDSNSVYQISLIVEDENGCRDTSSKYLWYQEESWMYIPNAFTPDLDGINDRFCISYGGIRENTFVFNLYNKNSELIFSTNDIRSLECSSTSISGWNGKDLNGNEVPMGVYIYELYYQDVNGWKYDKTNSLLIVR